AVAGEHRAEGCGDGDATLGIEPQHEVRHEAVHNPHSTPSGRIPREPPGLVPVRPSFRSGLGPLGRNSTSNPARGISWDNMGVNGTTGAGLARASTDAPFAINGL